MAATENKDLYDVDVKSADIILKLQLNDIEEALAALGPLQDDQRLSLQLSRDDVCRHIAIVSDRIFSTSITTAWRTDQLILRNHISIETRAVDDRNYALGLAGNDVPSAPSTAALPDTTGRSCRRPTSIDRAPVSPQASQAVAQASQLPTHRDAPPAEGSTLYQGTPVYPSAMLTSNTPNSLKRKLAEDTAVDQVTGKRVRFLEVDSASPDNGEHESVLSKTLSTREHNTGHSTGTLKRKSTGEPQAAPRAPVPKKQSTQVTCVVCAADVPAAKAVTMPCGDLYCAWDKRRLYNAAAQIHHRGPDRQQDPQAVAIHHVGDEVGEDEYDDDDVDDGDDDEEDDDDVIHRIMDEFRDDHDCDHTHWQHINGRHRCDECGERMPLYITNVKIAVRDFATSADTTRSMTGTKEEKPRSSARYRRATGAG
ncbi:Hypothetical protein D9617_9g025790 [Elsinoe fawcettii]|nr:Hypothetical protein D9617_9g025790 [Elsinoe fawcettii]